MRWLQCLLLLVSMGSAIGCSDDKRPPKSDLSRNDLKPEPERGDAGAFVCYRAGCACDDDGATRECGTIKEQVAGYTWCSLGLQVCEEGAWSECQSDRIVLSKQMLNLRLQGLGSSRQCGDDNPCSPGCNMFEDDAGGLPLLPDGGLVESDGGLLLAESPNVQGGSCVSIEITPSTTELEVTQLSPLAPNTATFSARVLPDGCAGEDAEVGWSVDRVDVAQISSDGVVTLIAPTVGAIQVSAFAGRISATATLTISIAVDDTSSAPPSAPTFGALGDAPDSLLTWLYPYEGTVFPPNVNAPLVQWDSVVAAEASWNGGCALRADGRVRCWGTNYYGDIVDRTGPYVQLSGRYAHFCALTPAGEAQCWGDNTYGQAANRTGPFVQVVAGAQHSCALRVDGTAECWGRNHYQQTQPPTGRFTKLTAGAYTNCGIREHGDVECWGNASGGQGGITTGPFIEVAAGTDHVCAIRRDRALQCWGTATNGQTSAPQGAYVSLDAGTYHTCALRTDGSAACWGLNNRGQSAAMVGPFTSVSAAREQSCGVLTTGGVSCIGNSDDNHTVGLPGGAVQVGLRFPATGNPVLLWKAVVAESRGLHLDAPINTVATPPAPRFTIPQQIWEVLGASARGQDFALTVQRHTGDRLLNVVERVARISESPLRGTITYQSYGTRSVVNTVGVYEDNTEGWGAAVFSYDTRSRTSSVIAGFTGGAGATGIHSGCRGCHSIGSENHFLLAGIDNQLEATFQSLDDPESSERLLPNAGQEYGGALWAAVHPNLPVAISSRGPTPCAVRQSDTSGSCAANAFVGADLTGTGYVLQSAPGGMVGAAWFDSDNDGDYDSSSPNQMLDLGMDHLGANVGTSPGPLRAAMPVFSPEGDRVAFVHYGGDVEDGVGTVHAGDQRSLGMMDFASDSLQLYNFQRLTAEPDAVCDNRFSSQSCADVWPSFLPGGAGVVFERQVFGNGGVDGTHHSELGGTRSGCELKDQASCNDGAKGDLWWVSLDSDGQPTGRYRLDQASGVVGGAHLVTQGSFTTPGVEHSNEVEPLLSFQPAAAPTSFGSHRWVAFTSRRAYGNVATRNPWWSDPRLHPIRHEVATKKIWVTALDTSSSSGDPSAPAFYLEGQELRGSNGRAVWVSDECIAPAEQLSEATECQSDADCCGAPATARCQVQLPLTSPAVRHCVTVDADTCVDDDSVRMCQTDEECCGFDEGERCLSGECRRPPPLARYQPATFVRDFHAQCPHGTLPHWKFLEWQAKLPAGTSIAYTAASASTQAELATAGAVYLATANPPDTSTWTTWSDQDSESIDAKLVAEGYPSRDWLRVTMTLNPDATLIHSPVLTSWRLVYDCDDSF